MAKFKKTQVTSSFNVNFSFSTGGSAKGELKAEVDSRDPADGGLNASTSFRPGDSVKWLLFKSNNVSITDIFASHGSNAGGGTASVDINDTITVGGVKETSLNYPCSGGFSANWLGSGGITAAITAPSGGQSTITFSGGGAAFDKYGAIGLLEVSYTATAQVYTLSHSPLGLDKYDIVVFVAAMFDEPV